jgi:PKD repeat protein
MLIFMVIVIFFVLGNQITVKGLKSNEHDRPGETRSPALWTFMVYLDADSNLNDAGYDDMNEMETAGSTTEVNIIVLFDGNVDGDSKLYKITTDPNGYDDIIVSEDISGSAPFMSNEMIMSDPQNLESFVIWCIANYPAEHYALSIWDHGDGIFRGASTDSGCTRGFCFDGGEMQLWELRDVLANIYGATGCIIDIVGFDVCLLGQIETHYQLIPYVGYGIASEMIEPSDGWDYQTSLSALVTNPYMTPEELAQQIVNDYTASYNDGTQGVATTTQASVNLTALNSTFIPILNSFATELYNFMYTYQTEIEDARTGSESYENYDCVDLYHFAERIYNTATLPSSLRTVALNLMDAYDTTVIANGHTGSGTANAHGMTIYFPMTGYQSIYDDPNYIMFSNTFWNEFLHEFQNPTVYHIEVTATVIDADNCGFENDVDIYVVDTNALPVTDAQVTIDDVLVGTTDTDGHLVAYNFSKGTHFVHVSKDAYFDTCEFTVANQPPIAIITADKTDAPAGDTIRFSASASYDPDDDTLTYYWDFDDTDGIQTDAVGVGPVSHTYPDDGVFTITLTVKDNENAKATSNIEVTITNVPPVADAGDDIDTIEDEPVTFDATESYDTPQDTLTLMYAWNFGDGSEDATGPTVTHTYTEQGVYEVILTVTDDNGATATDTLSVLVRNVPPIADAGEDIVVNEDDEVLFDASGSNDTPTDAQQLAYHWDFNAVDGTEDIDATGIQVTHTYTQEAEYQVTLTVIDNNGATATDTITVFVNNIPPIANAGSNLVVDEDEEVVFDATGSTDTPSDIPTLSYEWNFGDNYSDVEGAHGPYPKHTYTHAGLYKVKLLVEDDDGATNISTIYVRVNNVPPRVTITSDYDDKTPLAEDMLVRLYGVIWDTPSDIETLSYYWEFGDGTTWSEGLEVSHRYINKGNYEVKLIVTDDDGATAIASINLTVYNPAPVPTIIVDSTEVYVGETLRFSAWKTYDTRSDMPYLIYEWDFTTDGIPDNDKINVTHTYTKPGKFMVTLTVRDDDWAIAEVTINITVIAREPPWHEIFTAPTIDNYGLFLYMAFFAVILGVIVGLMLRRYKTITPTRGAPPSYQPPLRKSYVYKPRVGEELLSQTHVVETPTMTQEPRGDLYPSYIAEKTPKPTDVIYDKTMYAPGYVISSKDEFISIKPRRAPITTLGLRAHGLSKSPMETTTEKMVEEKEEVGEERIMEPKKLKDTEEEEEEVEWMD